MEEVNNMFIDKLITSIQEKKSPVVVGLDPRLEMIPESVKNKYIEQFGKGFRAAGKAIEEFNKEIIDNVYDIVPAVKPQIAFYEKYGIEGLMAYINTCEYAASKGLVVVGDIKRGDIGSTSQAYSTAHIGKTEIDGEYFEAFPSDVITINPYLGDDCIKEFMEAVKKYEKGIFVLVKTSNPSSKQLQDIETKINKKNYEIVAEMVDKWCEDSIGSHGYSSVGAVVGATYPEEMKELRKLMARAYFLVPGYGAQGGTAEDVVDSFNEDGLGAIVNSSRGIIYAYKNDKENADNYGQAARKASMEMKDAINNALEKANKRYW